MNTENTIVPATDVSAPGTALRPPVVVEVTDISAEKPRDVLVSSKSELKIYEQPEPSVSIGDTIPMTTPKSNAIKNSTETASDNIVDVAMETETEFLKRELKVIEIVHREIESEQLNIKVACEALLDDLNGVTSSDRKIFYTFNSINKFYREIGVDEDKNAKSTELVNMSTSCSLSFTDQYVVEKVQELNVSIGLFIDKEIELECLLKEINNFTDDLLNTLADFMTKLYEEHPDILRKPQTGTP